MNTTRCRTKCLWNPCRFQTSSIRKPWWTMPSLISCRTAAWSMRTRCCILPATAWWRMCLTCMPARNSSPWTVSHSGITVFRSAIPAATRSWSCTITKICSTRRMSLILPLINPIRGMSLWKWPSASLLTKPESIREKKGSIPKRSCSTVRSWTTGPGRWKCGLCPMAAAGSAKMARKLSSTVQKA